MFGRWPLPLDTEVLEEEEEDEALEDPLLDDELEVLLDEDELELVAAPACAPGAAAPSPPQPASKAVPETRLALKPIKAKRRDGLDPSFLPLSVSFRSSGSLDMARNLRLRLRR